jgi:aryl-alcohol dehydrogenase-like predicted oxidoreductase
MLPIPGTASVKHLEENVGAARIELLADEMDEPEGLVSRGG